MREIKFRAWDDRYYKMEYNPLVSTYDAKVNDEFYFAKSGQSGLVFMQYTGLKDKNGKEIYEGDILSEKWKVQVYQEKNTGAFMVKFYLNPEGNNPQTLYDYLKNRERAGTVERDNLVIGNIYQNPELLK